MPAPPSDGTERYLVLEPDGLANMGRAALGLERVGVDVYERARWQNVQPLVPERLGDVVGGLERVARRHADVRDDVDRAADVPDPELVDVVESGDALDRVLELVLEVGVAVVEQAEDDLAP